MARKASGGISADLRRSGGTLIILAFALMACGMLAIIYPLAATVATLAWLGALFALCGLLQLLHVWTARGWAPLSWHMAGGALCLLGGLMILFDPLMGAVAITLLIAAILIGAGLLRLGVALAMRPEPGWGRLAASGALSAGAGAAIVLLPPGASVLLPGLLVGLALLVDGGVLMSLALLLRRAA